MAIDNSIIVLGTGTSTGVPVLTCSCQVCLSKNPFNKRTRSSIIFRYNGKNTLVDVSPDFRDQALTSKISAIDQVIITHQHADHTHGIDDLRPFSFRSKSSIPLYTSGACKKALELSFSYIFNQDWKRKNPHLGGTIPMLALSEVSMGQNFLGDLEVEFFPMPHGNIMTLGIVFLKKVAYIVDTSELSEKILLNLKNLNLTWLIIDCATNKPHKTHLDLEKALKYARYIGAKNTGLTHLSHHFDHVELSKQIESEENITPLHDGQILYY